MNPLRREDPCTQNQENAAVTCSSWDTEGVGSYRKGVPSKVSALCHACRDLVLECAEGSQETPSLASLSAPKGEEPSNSNPLGERCKGLQPTHVPERWLLFIQGRREFA